VAAVAGHDGVDEIATPLNERFRASSTERRAERGYYDRHNAMDFWFGTNATCND
jgi:hypothetical protein